MTIHPETHALGLVNWDLFCTLTLPNNLQQAGTGRLGSTIFAFLRYAARFQSVHFNRLLWCLRSEKGEQTGRLHFHLLLAGFPKVPTVRDRFALKNRWENITAAMSRVSRFDSSLPGVAYVLKGGVAYEAGKFAESADVVTISNSLVPTLKRLVGLAS